MPQLRGVPKSVRKITVLDSDGTVTVHSKSGKSRGKRNRGRKKGYRLLRPVSRWARTMARAHAAASDDFIGRHERADRKKRDGGLRKWYENAYKAQKRAFRIIRKQYF